MRERVERGEGAYHLTWRREIISGPGVVGGYVNGSCRADRSCLSSAGLESIERWNGKHQDFRSNAWVRRNGPRVGVSYVFTADLYRR